MFGRREAKRGKHQSINLCLESIEEWADVSTSYVVC